MEKFIKINSNLINVNNIADIYTETYDSLNATYIILDTNNGTHLTMQIPEYIDTIDDMVGAYKNMITTFLTNKEPDEPVLDLDVYDVNRIRKECIIKETTFKGCINCAYCGTRDDSSKYCVIYDKELSSTVCDLYKSAETAMTELTERTKLREAVQFLQKYCENKLGCKGCPFSGSTAEGCRLATTPESWNTDYLM